MEFRVAIFRSAIFEWIAIVGMWVCAIDEEEKNVSNVLFTTRRERD